VGSGSVVTADVPPDALALGRGRQTVKEGWATAWRAAHANRPKKARHKG
jgi:bifunctional UDP-N-acetylglucosamine pyrophosphorylase/glucosamine-1-phosphate N-acetyltransferase